MLFEKHHADELATRQSLKEKLATDRGRISDLILRKRVQEIAIKMHGEEDFEYDCEVFLNTSGDFSIKNHIHYFLRASEVKRFCAAAGIYYDDFLKVMPPMRDARFEEALAKL